MKETEFIAHKNGRGTNIDRAKMAEVSKIVIEKQTDPWNGEKPGQDAKKTEKTIITYRRISKRLAVDTTSLYCLCSQITSTNHSCSSLLKSKHAIS